jgi:hypothetical protein
MSGAPPLFTFLIVVASVVGAWWAFNRAFTFFYDEGGFAGLKPKPIDPYVECVIAMLDCEPDLWHLRADRTLCAPTGCVTIYSLYTAIIEPVGVWRGDMSAPVQRRLHKAATARHAALRDVAGMEKAVRAMDALKKARRK